MEQVGPNGDAQRRRLKANLDAGSVSELYFWIEEQKEAIGGMKAGQFQTPGGLTGREVPESGLNADTRAFPLMQNSRGLITPTRYANSPAPLERSKRRTEHQRKAAVSQVPARTPPRDRLPERTRSHRHTGALRSYVTRSAPAERAETVPSDPAAIHRAAERARARGNASRSVYLLGRFCDVISRASAGW